MTHDQKVQQVIAALRRHDPKRPLSLKKKAVSHEVPKHGDQRRFDAKIDVTALDEILSVDVAAQTCTAEPGVTFIDLVRATLRVGLIPVVVPELETITIGGAVSGCSIESMSFRYGGFHDSCLEYEVVTTEGKVLTCTPDNENHLVFQMMHGAFGTLGILTKLTFKLVPAKPYVKVTYKTYTTLESFKAAVHQHFVDRDVDFMDAILHAPNKLVLCLGELVDSAPYTHRYDWVTVYYQTTAKRKEDYFKTKDYFFRYDRGVTNPTPRSFLGRLLFGKVLDSATVLRIAARFHELLLSKERPSVILDVFLPFSNVDKFFEWYRGSINYFPLWCVPYRVPRRYEWIADGYLDGVDDELFLDIAIYGLEQPEGRNYYKELEDALYRFRGIKTLISHNYYEEEQFWSIWNKQNYDAVKAVTDPRNLQRDLFTKTCLISRGAAKAGVT